MDQNRKRMLFYFEWLESFEDLTDEEAGQLTLAVVRYAQNGFITEFSDRTLRMVFKMICKQIDRDNEAYAKKCEVNRENAKKGGAPKGNTNAAKTETTETTETTERLKKQPKQPDEDEDEDKDKDKDSLSERDARAREEREAGGREAVCEYFKEQGFARDPIEFIDYNLGLGHTFDDPVKWKAWARSWEKKKPSDTVGGIDPRLEAKYG